MKRLLAASAAIALIAAQASAQTQITTATGANVLTSRESGNNFGAVVNVPSTGFSAPGSNAAQARGVVLLSPAGVPYSATGGGGGGGTVSNGTDAQAPTATNQGVTSYNYGFNGTSWDRLLSTAGQIQTRAYGSAAALLGQGATGTAANSQTVQGLAANGAAVVGNPTLIAGYDGTSARTVLTTASGVLAAPQSAAANRVVTRTAVAATTSTTICPAAANVVATTVFIPLSGTGIGWAGQALTTAVPGTTNTTPEFATSAANFTWTPLVAPTNLVTAYTATAETIVCVQDVRQ